MSSIEFYKKIWIQTLEQLSKENQNFSLQKTFIKSKVIYKNSILHVYSKSSNIEYLNNFLSEIEFIYSKNFENSISIFLKPYFYELRDELQKEHEFFFNKHINKNFILHSRNKVVFDFLWETLDDEDSNAYFLWGNNGIGKTHLMAFFLQKLTNEKPNIDFLYINIFDFSNNFYKFIKDKDDEKKFIELFCPPRIIILDDIHLIKNRENIANIIYLIIKKIKSCNYKIIFISNINFDILSLDQKISLIISSGFIFKLNEPNINDVNSIIGNFIKEHNQNLKITNETINYLGSILGNHIPTIINRLINILVFFETPFSTKIINIANLKKIQEKISFFKKTTDLINHTNNHQLKNICQKLNFNIADITGKWRKKIVILNRNIIIYIFKTKLNFSHEYIGKILNRDHSTITHSLKQMDIKLQENDFRNYMILLLEKIF